LTTKYHSNLAQKSKKVAMSANVYYAGIWANPFGVKNPEHVRKALDITRWGLELHNISGITVYENVEELLATADRQNRDYAVIQSAGAWGDWQWLRDGVSWLTEEKTKEPWLVAGHILDFKDEWYWLHPQYFVINIPQWRRLGRPQFGVYAGQKTNIDLPNSTRSPDNVHDGYTPLWLRPEPGHTNMTVRLKHGWNMIKTSLEHGLTVVNIPDRIRRQKGNTYIEDRRFGRFLECIMMTQEQLDLLPPDELDYSQLKYAKHATERYVAYGQGVYVNNNESIEDAVTMRHPPVDHLICVAAGFKPNFILNTCGFHDGTRISWMDISQPALDFKRWLAANWDGTDLDAAWRRGKPDASHWNGENDRTDLQDDLNRFLGIAGMDQAQWLDNWSRFRRLEADFQLLDFVTNQAALLDLIRASTGQSIVVWISNALITIPTILQLNWKRETSTELWLARMQKACQDIADQQGKTITVLSFRPQADVSVRPGGGSRYLPAALGYDYQSDLRNLKQRLDDLGADADARQLRENINGAGLPWMRTELQLPHQQMLVEAMALEEYFVSHRGTQDHRGWRSLVIHGLDAHRTDSYEKYGYAAEPQAEYRWTWVADACPVTTTWLKSLDIFQNLQRIRFMLLEPLGYITQHQDRATHSLYPINIALSQPKGCDFTMLGYGAVPFTPGDAYAVDIGNQHTVINSTEQKRMHMIIHGTPNDNYWRMLQRSVNRLTS